ncbi:MAG: hypothetical protein ACXACI_10485 [Candidatus Hodarchaeales archaeon]
MTREVIESDTLSVVHPIHLFNKQLYHQLKHRIHRYSLKTMKARHLLDSSAQF